MAGRLRSLLLPPAGGGTTASPEAGIDTSPLEGPHISLSEAAKRLASSSSARLNTERSLLRPADAFWE